MEVRWFHRVDDRIIERKTWFEGEKNIEVNYPFIHLYDVDPWGRYEIGTINMFEKSVVYRTDRAHKYAQKVFPLDEWVKWRTGEVKVIVMEEE